MMLDRYSLQWPDRLTREMDRLFNSVLDGGTFHRVRAFPAINVWEDADRLYAEAELPGLSLNDVEIFVVGDELTLKGHRPTDSDKDATYHRRERGTGDFSRVLTLPVEVDAEKVEATLRDGVLTIVMPKAEAAKPRKITIREK